MKNNELEITISQSDTYNSLSDYFKVYQEVPVKGFNIHRYKRKWWFKFVPNFIIFRFKEPDVIFVNCYPKSISMVSDIDTYPMSMNVEYSYEERKKC
jgi:hypothetical protein